MSITALSDHKKPSNRRKDSIELDVFEAARYFSGYNDNYALMGDAKVINNKEERRGYYREGRVSLDVPSLKNFYLHHNNHPIAEPPPLQPPQKTKEKKKHKQPSSPGGKIAQFLNSLFSSQTNSNKKKGLKSLSSSSQFMKDEDESPIGRRKRRSSISHFRSTSSAIDTRSLYSSSSSGFRTPPPYNLNTPKSCKDLRSISDYKDVLATLSKYNIRGNGNGNGNGNRNFEDEKIKGSNNDLDWIDEKLRLKNGLIEKTKNFNHGHHQQEKNKENKKYNNNNNNNNNNNHVVDDDGGDSDSSSDLFELQIDYGFGFCSSGLPVYETTHMDNIKRSSANAITNGPIKA